MNTLKELLSAYTATVKPLENGDGTGFVARYNELGLTARGIGETPALALADLEELCLDTLGGFDLGDLPSPESPKSWDDFSGRVTLRVPKMLHAKLTRHAELQGVSLNQWICQILESASTAVDAGWEFGISTQSSVKELYSDLRELRDLLDTWGTHASRSEASGNYVASQKKLSSTIDYREELKICA